MKFSWKWIIGVVIVLVLLLALPYLLRAIFGYGYGGMMFAPGASADGYRYWGHPMMGGYGFLPFGGILMGFGMLLMWLVPLGLLFLIVYGAVRLAGGSHTPAPTRVCSNCGKSLQADWNTCPYCGTTV